MYWQEKSMATLGYARTSTRDQEAGLQAQIRDLIAAGCAERDIYTEQASSVRERPELVNRRGTGPLIGIQSGPLYGGRDRFVPVANGRAPRASRSAFTSDAAAGAGGTCLPTGASRGGTPSQARFLKRQLSLPVSMMSQ